MSFSSLCIFWKKLSLILCLNELTLFVDFRSEDRLFHIFGPMYTHRNKVAYEEPFRVLEQDTYMEPLKVLQGTPNQVFFKEPLPMVLQRTPKGTSENP